MSTTKLVFSFITTLLSFAIVTAQDSDCAALVQKIIEQSRNACPTVEVNQACYGNASVKSDPRGDVQVKFSKPGDSADLSSLEGLTTGAFDENTDAWGVALLQVRADLVNGATSWIAFGDVSIENLSQATSDFYAFDVTVTYPQGANVRQQPSPDAPLIKTLNTGEVVKAVGRSVDSVWIRLLDGWVSADLVRSSADLNLLKVVSPDEAIMGDIYAPLQTFRMRSGIDDAPCSGMSDSGLLIQTPDGAGSVLIVANGASLNLSGTIYLQTSADGKTLISVLEGQVGYDNGKTLDAAEKVQYGYQGDAIVYEQPDEYNYARARYLPLQLLPREFELPFSLGGVIFPFTPGTGFLNGIAADAACTVAWTVDVNIRSGPGTNYPIRRGVSSGYYGLPDARAAGTDGAVWWRLADGIWLAANNTAAGGACGSLPLVEPPPLPAKP